MDLLFIILNDMLFAGLPSIGFAMIFSVPPKILPYCALCGAVGHSFRYILMTYANTNVEFGSYLAAAVIGFMGLYWAKKNLAHPKVVTVAGIIPMIPGVFAYKTMIGIAEINRVGYSSELFGWLIDNLVKTFFIVGALALGLLTPVLLFYRGRPIFSGKPRQK